MNKDLTTGSPDRVLWRFCLPLFGSVVFQQLYNLADSWVAGKYIGQDALAAVGNSYEITLIFIAFAFGCNIGCSVLVSRLFGAKDYSGMKSAVSTTMVTAAAVCATLMLGGLLGCNLLLRLIHTPEAVFADSALYLDIYVWGLPFVFFYNLSTGIFSALGDSRTPFLFLAVSSLSNIAMDVVMVTTFDLGVAGLAWATFLCQGVSCLLAVVVVLLRLRKLPGTFRWFDGGLLKRFVVIALPSTLQQSFISVGNILIQRVINGFGTDVMAGYSAGVKLNNLVITSFTTIGNGISNFASQNLGAMKIDRIRQGLRAGLKMVWILSIPLIALYCGFSRGLIEFFIQNPTEKAVESGMLFLRILAPFYFVASTKLAIDGILRGTGKMRQFMAATLSDLVLRVVLAFVLSATVLGSAGIWASWPLGWIVGMLLSLTFYRHCKWDARQ